MNKEQCLLEVARLMRRCNILRKGDCEKDFDSQRCFRDEVKNSISKMVVDSSTWHNAIDNVIFSACSGICDFGYDKQVSQEAFTCGWDVLYRILVQLKTKLAMCSEDDIRWNCLYKGGRNVS